MELVCLVINKECMTCVAVCMHNTREYAKQQNKDLLAFIVRMIRKGIDAIKCTFIGNS